VLGKKELLAVKAFRDGKNFLTAVLRGGGK
jgi:hypothetical protein